MASHLSFEEKYHSTDRIHEMKKRGVPEILGHKKHSIDRNEQNFGSSFSCDKVNFELSEFGNNEHK